MFFAIEIKAFGWNWNKQWGDPSKVIEIIEGAITILTVGIDFQLCI